MNSAGKASEPKTRTFVPLLPALCRFSSSISSSLNKPAARLAPPPKSRYLQPNTALGARPGAVLVSLSCERIPFFDEPAHLLAAFFGVHGRVVFNGGGILRQSLVFDLVPKPRRIVPAA